MVHKDDDDELPERRPDRSWPTRIAWTVLFGGAALIVARASLGTVVQIHGDGMAPTILDGDHVVLVRGTWKVEPGDIVVYDPTPELANVDMRPTIDRSQAPKGGDKASGFPDARRLGGGPLRNTAVVELDDIERNWNRMQENGVPKRAAKSFRVGRVIAEPGDRITFNLAKVPLGIAVNDRPLERKNGDPVRVYLNESDPSEPVLRTLAYESVRDRRYPILVEPEPAPVTWQNIALPSASEGPVEIVATGYLILADNRDEGACCDSRAVGFVPVSHLRGELIVRLAGNPNGSPDIDPKARGLTLLP